MKLQYEEVQAVRWASKEEILSMIDDKIFIPYHKSVIEMVFDMRHKRGVGVMPRVCSNDCKKSSIDIK